MSERRSARAIGPAILLAGCAAVGLLAALFYDCGADELPKASAIAATVGGEPIYAGEVAQVVKSAVHERKVSPAAMPVLQAQALAEIVDRRLVLAYARRHAEYPAAGAIDAAIAALKAKLLAEGRTLEEYRRDQSFGASDLVLRYFLILG